MTSGSNRKISKYLSRNQEVVIFVTTKMRLGLVLQTWLKETNHIILLFFYLILLIKFLKTIDLLILVEVIFNITEL